MFGILFVRMTHSHTHEGLHARGIKFAFIFYVLRSAKVEPANRFLKILCFVNLWYQINIENSLRSPTYHYKILVNGRRRLRDRSMKLSRNPHLTPPIPITWCLSTEKECVLPKYKNTPCLQKTDKFPTLPKPYNTEQYPFYSTDAITTKLLQYTPIYHLFIALFFAFHAVRLRSPSL
jgi:hypothetical protein